MILGNYFKKQSRNFAFLKMFVKRFFSFSRRKSEVLPEIVDLCVDRKSQLWSCFDHDAVEGTEGWLWPVGCSNVRKRRRRTSGRWLRPPLVFRQQPYLSSSSTPRRPPKVAQLYCEGHVGMGKGGGGPKPFSMTSAGPSRHLGWRRRTNDRSYILPVYYYIQMVVKGGGGGDDVIARSWCALKLRRLNDGGIGFMEA